MSRLSHTQCLREAMLRTIGAAPDEIKEGGFTRFSTNGRKSNRDGWASVSEDGTIFFGCWRQGITSAWPPFDSENSVHTTPSFIETPRGRMTVTDDPLKRARINNALWSRSHTLVQDSACGRYLANRGLALDLYPDCLRMGTHGYYEGKYSHGIFPVLLGAVTDKSGTLIALHRTYLSEEGQKTDVPHPKKLTPTSGPLAGCSIKLAPPRLLGAKVTLGVAEGIETALACNLGSAIPTWSCLSASGMKSFAWPDEVESLVIFADNDHNGVGQAAARELAARAAAAGLEVRILVPATPGADWLDVFIGRAE